MQLFAPTLFQTTGYSPAAREIARLPLLWRTLQESQKSDPTKRS